MKTPVAILAATGMVGQKMIRLLENHPLFYVAEVAASDRGLGESYSKSVTWREETLLPPEVSHLKLKNFKDLNSQFVLSALPSDVSLEVEPYLAQKGHIVVSNASGWRMDAEVPLLVPEINLSHLDLIKKQKSTGKIITNPNCSTVFLVMALAPLLELGKIEEVYATTLQALSGAGHPGVPAFDLLGNTIPNINGEEKKIRQETKKILGSPDQEYPLHVSVQVNRVPVVHGHSVSMHVNMQDKISLADVYEVFESWKNKNPYAFEIYVDEFSPRPATHLNATDMRTHIGRIQKGEKENQISLVSMGHNLVRGAAGAAILNLEHVKNYLSKNI